MHSLDFVKDYIVNFLIDLKSLLFLEYLIQRLDALYINVFYSAQKHIKVLSFNRVSFMLLKLLGQRVKDIRSSLSLSQEELSKLSGVSRGQISKIENGQANLTVETIEKIANALNVKVTHLLDDGFYKENRQTYLYYADKLAPFVKWAGGKTQLLDEIKKRMPKSFNHYFEPFVGGGALFFSVAPEKASINDFNEELMFAYQAIRSDSLFTKLTKKLEEHEEKHSEDYYLEIRALDRTPNFKKLPIEERAARLIYLNKACFNGLYRVNSKGYFNVPSGKKAKVKAFNRESLHNIHNYFASNKIEFTSLDFEIAVKNARKGDFVYFDPPYDPFEEKQTFTSYSKDNFGRDAQIRLFKVFDELSHRGVYVMLSNHNTQFIRDLYKDYNLSVVGARRSINSVGSKRGTVEEIIITNY